LWGFLKVTISGAESAVYEFGTFRLDAGRRLLWSADAPLSLTPKVFDTLLYLIGNAGKTVDKDELMAAIWPDTVVEENNLNKNISALRQLLGEKPGEHRFIATVPGKGYRFVAAVAKCGESDIQEPENVPSDDVLPVSLHLRPPEIEQRTRRVTFAGLRYWLAALTIILCAAAYYFWERNNSRNAEAIHSIAVLPLQNLTGDPGQEYFVDGMTDALITELGKISSLRVISRTSVMAFKDTKKTLPEIARQLGVDAILEGAVTRSGDRVRISARVIHLSQERTLWAENYERDLREISNLQSEIVLVVADEIKVKLLSDEQARLAKVRPVNPRAYEAYLMGRYLQARRNPEDMRKSLTYFQHALEIDPGYAPAYIGIVDCYSIGGGRHMLVSIKEADSRMKEAAHKALELDSTTAAAHYALAMVKWHEWDFPGAEKEFRRALELNPGGVQVRQHYAHYLLTVRRPADARREIQHALTLDPLSAMLTVDLGHTYAYSRQYPEAIQQGQKALAMEKDFLYARMMLCWAYWEAGQEQEALRAGWPIPFRPEINRHAMEIYERAGARETLRWMAEDAVQRHSSGDFYARSSYIALSYAEFDDKENAFAWLEKAYQERDPWLPMDLAHPAWDRLSSDPRFQDTLHRVGLPE
jgi:TolB-like protein/DNA-binding winged helix-turn-helix (wHTH) protein